MHISTWTQLWNTSTASLKGIWQHFLGVRYYHVMLFAGTLASANNITWSQKTTLCLVNPHCSVLEDCFHYEAESEQLLHGLSMLLTKVECTPPAHEVREAQWSEMGLTYLQVPHEFMYAYTCADNKGGVTLMIHTLNKAANWRQYVALWLWDGYLPAGAKKPSGYGTLTGTEKLLEATVDRTLPSAAKIVVSCNAVVELMVNGGKVCVTGLMISGVSFLQICGLTPPF